MMPIQIEHLELEKERKLFFEPKKVINHYSLTIQKRNIMGYPIK